MRATAAETPQGRDSSADATALYIKAVTTMQALPQPAFATFVSSFVGDRTAFEISRKDDGGVRIAIGTGTSPPVSVPTEYRAADRLAALTLQNGLGRTHSPLVDPTWAGAAAFARYGLHPPEVTAPAPAPATTGELPVIASVSAFAVSFYTVSDWGATPCPSGTDGESLHLIAFREPNTHPLTDVTIESGTHRICSMRFKLHLSGPVAYAPVVELHFSPVDRFYLSTEGFIDGELHVFGLGVQHTHVSLARSGLAFPATLPDAHF